MQEINVHINIGTVLKIIGLLLALYVLYLVKSIILLLFVSLLLALLIDPLVTWLHKRKIPRALSILTVYAFLLSLIILIIALFTPILVNDLPQLLNHLGDYLVKFQDTTIWNKLVQGVQSVQSVLANYGFTTSGESGMISGATVPGTFFRVISTITDLFGSLFSLILILVFTFYLIVEKVSLEKIFYYLIPSVHSPSVLATIRKIRDRLGDWIKGQLIVSLVVGVLIFTGLAILNFRYAIVLALIAAILEFIPYAGPVFASVPAIILALSQGGTGRVLLVALVYLIVHEIEANLLLPKVMQKAVGLNPIISIVAILAGAKLAGVLGVLLAIPVATALSVLIQDVLAKKEANN